MLLPHLKLAQDSMKECFGNAFQSANLHTNSPSLSLTELWTTVLSLAQWFQLP